MSVEKIGSQHRAREAVLYVRQSSVHQVQHNRESQGLQYAMRDRLLQLGWSQVEVIDEDLGCSAAGGTQTPGKHDGEAVSDPPPVLDRTEPPAQAGVGA